MGLPTPYFVYEWQMFLPTFVSTSPRTPSTQLDAEYFEPPFRVELSVAVAESFRSEERGGAGGG